MALQPPLKFGNFGTLHIGRAGPCGTQESTARASNAPAIPKLSNSELVQLRVRVITLENLVLALLTDASALQLSAGHEKAALILPRTNAHPHPLTIQAAAQMEHLLERAGNFTAPVAC